MATDSIMLAFAAFLLGVIIGIFLPFFCIKFYNLVGIHLGDVLDDDETSEPPCAIPATLAAFAANYRRSNTMKVNYKRLTADAEAPKVATAGSAGADISSAVDVTIKPGETKLIPTRIVMEIPAGHVGLMFPRSGLSLKTPLRQPNSVGVIDSDYRGEVRGMFQNTGDETVVIERGDRIAQIVIIPIPHVEWGEVDELSETERGEGGFGSTGR